MRSTLAALFTIAMLPAAHPASAFCGFYVAKADTGLFNQASQVVLVRDAKRTVITMANDFSGDADDFAVVIPVPTFIERSQVNVGEKSLIDHLDAYTAPRLVEYFDPDPCRPRAVYEMRSQSSADGGPSRLEKALGVTVEASYTVGEYDIMILSGEQSAGLIEWLEANGYRLPEGAEPIVDSYLRQDMRFFVAKINLEARKKSGRTYLRPLQIAFESRRFMLPIRLGTLNAEGAQELFVYALTRTGRVETTNYRTVRLPSDAEVPAFVEDDFGAFYRSMFTQQVEEQDRRAVFLEYAWDMAWCDPCAADPLSAEQLRRLGVFWLGAGGGDRAASGPAQDVFVTRLHVRYDAETFPEDLMFQETGDRSNFQGRYVIRHAFDGETGCDASDYFARVRERQDRAARNLADLTGWGIDDIRRRMPGLGEAGEPTPWWRTLWD